MYLQCTGQVYGGYIVHFLAMYLQCTNPVHHSLPSVTVVTLLRLEKVLLAGGRYVWSDEHQSTNNKYMRTFLPETELSVDDSVPMQVCGD